jgi:hypothetical protein
VPEQQGAKKSTPFSRLMGLGAQKKPENRRVEILGSTTPKSRINGGRMDNTNLKIGDLTPFDESTIFKEEMAVGDIKDWVEQNKPRGSDVVGLLAARFDPKKKPVADGEGTPT